MTHYLHISFVWNGTAKTAEQLKPLFDIAEDWITYGSSNWLIYTDLETHIWAARFRAVLGPTDLLFICEVTDITGTDGWLPNWIWEWILKDRSKPYLIGPSA